MAGFRGAPFTLTGSGEPRALVGALVSPGFFELLGVQPGMGRSFRPEEHEPGHNLVAIVGHDAWEKYLDSAPDAIGRRISLNGAVYTVVGVMPRGFRWFLPYEIWTPLALNEAQWNNRGSRNLILVGRLMPNVAIRSAQAEIDTITARLQSAFPDVNSSFGLQLVSLHEVVVGNIKGSLFALVGAVAFVLLIVCVNVSSLALARIIARQRDIVVRVALGISRWRLCRLILTEGILIAGIGSIAGLILADTGIWALHVINPPNVPRLDEIQLNGKVLLFALAASVVTGILVELLPVFSAFGPDLMETLKQGGRTSGGSGRGRTREMLIVGETALALILLVSAGLMIESFMRLQGVDPGFDPGGVLTAQIPLSPRRYESADKQLTFFRSVLDGVKSKGGVISAAVAFPSPFQRDDQLPQFCCRKFSRNGRP